MCRKLADHRAASASVMRSRVPSLPLETSSTNDILFPSPTCTTFPSSASGLQLDIGSARVKMAAEDNMKRIEEAKKLAKDQPNKAEQIYKDIVSKPPSLTDAAVREYETALISLGELYRDQKSAITALLLAMLG